MMIAIGLIVLAVLFLMVRMVFRSERKRLQREINTMMADNQERADRWQREGL